MNECERIREQLSAYLDDELTEPEAEAVRAHLESCADCRAEYAAYLALSEALEPDELPEGLHASVMTKLAPELQKSRKRGQLVRLRPVLSAAAVLVVIVGCVFAMGGVHWGGSAAPKQADTSMVATSYGGYSTAEQVEAEARQTTVAATESVAEPAEEPAAPPVSMATAEPEPESAPTTDGFHVSVKAAEAPAANAAGGARNGDDTEPPELPANEADLSQDDEAAPEAAAPEHTENLDWSDEFTHALIESPADGTARRVEDLEELSVLIDTAVQVCLNAESSPNPAPASEPVLVIRFFTNDDETMRLSLSDDARLRVDEGVWLALSQEQVEALDTVLAAAD